MGKFLCLVSRLRTRVDYAIVLYRKWAEITEPFTHGVVVVIKKDELLLMAQF